MLLNRFQFPTELAFSLMLLTCVSVKKHHDDAIEGQGQNLMISYCSTVSTMVGEPTRVITPAKQRRSAEKNTALTELGVSALLYPFGNAVRAL